MSARITAIFVTYNSAGTICEALMAAKSCYDRGMLECIVVDNASSDKTIEMVRQNHSWVKLLASRENLGYGSGLNLGLSQVVTPFVLFMNPDAVLGPNDLAVLLDFMEEHPGAGLVAPAIIEGGVHLQAAGSLPTACGIIAAAAGTASRKGRRPIVPGEAPFQTDWLCGAILLSRTELIRNMNGFDSRFFLYFEETDLCRRILQRGLELWAVGTAAAQHVGGASAKTVDQGSFNGCLANHYFKSRYYYMVKHHGYLAASFAEIGELAVLLAQAVFRGMRGEKYRALRARLKAPILRLPSRGAL